MERYIKPLYIASIIAILAFLGLQIYWLFSRYEYTVKEFEDKLLPVVTESLDRYNSNRDIWSYKSGSRFQYLSSYSLSKEMDADSTKRSIKVSARKYEPWRLLGYSSPRKLTPEEYDAATQIALGDSADVDSVVISGDVSNAPSEAAMWSAGQSVELELKSPLTVEGVDSTLKANGICADIELIKADSITWRPELVRHSSLLRPSATVVFPYSVLEKKSLKINCSIPAADIIRSMLWTLVLAAIVSVLLIFCLICQFKIIFSLNRLDKMRNNFIITMIHELKRPVSTLKMCVSGLSNKKMVDDVEVREELLGDTRDALDLLSAYFSKMRDITFNDRSQIPLSCGMIDLRRLVEDTSKRIPVTSGKTVDFEIDIDAETQLYADPSHISNVLLNLFENAVKYSGNQVTIRVNSQTDEHGSVRISVKDNGKGIASSDIDKIFSRFYRGKASNTDIPGMGLGLAYVKLLVEAHGGAISVESHTDGPDQGSCFTINLPQ